MSTKQTTKAAKAGANKRGRADEEKTAPTPAASNARTSGASAAKGKSAAAASAAAAAGSSKAATAPSAAAPLAPPVLGARANAAWHATVGRTRKGRTALEQRDEDAENQAALEAVSTLDDDEADADDDDDAEDAEDAPEDASAERKHADEDDDDEEAGLEAELDFGDDSDDDGEDGSEDDEEAEDEEDEESEEEAAPKAKAKASKQTAAAAAAVAKAAASKPAKAAAASSKRSASAASTTDEDTPSSPSLRGSSSSVSESGPPRHPRGIRFDGEGMDDDTLDDAPFQGNLAEGSDSSADEGEDGRSVKHRNRIGNVPLEWYADYDHIGYDVTGKKIVKSQKGDKLDQLLARMDDPNWNRTVYDPVNDVSVVLTPEELSMITRLRKGQYAHGDFDPTSDQYTLQSFTEDIRHEVLGQSIEPKRRFVASKWEAKTVVKYVNAMRNGWMKMPSEVEAIKAEKAKPQLFLLWGEDGTAIRDPNAFTPHRMPAKITAPKPALPTHAESYNPPREYLPTEEEREEWEALPPEDRPTNFLPAAYDALRKVPAYDNLVKERFERCLDLYLCPRTKVKKLRNIDPASLIPNLPRPSDLRPFPTSLSIEYRGHTGMIRCISLSPCGQWLASGSDDGTVRIWEVSSGRCFRKWDFQNQYTETDSSIIVESVSFNPNPDVHLLAIGVGTHIFLVHTHTITDAGEKKKIQEMITMPSRDKEDISRTLQTEKQIRQVKAVSWKILDELVQEPSESGSHQEPTTSLVATSSLLKKPEATAVEAAVAAGLASPAAAAAAGGVAGAEITWSVLAIDCGHRVKSLAWHAKGDYFCSVTSLNTDSSSVLIHRLSQHQSQSPFAKSKGLVMQVLFHPLKPFLFVMTKRHIRIYNLVAQNLVKKLLCPAKWLSSLSIHPAGDHLIAGSFDRKVCWYDLDLSSAPYKTLKYHTKAVRSVSFHPKSPLFCSASDDGALHIFHGRVYEDLTTDPLIVPVKIIKAHAPVNDVGAMSAVWHPTEPWIFSSGADAVIRLFTC